MKKLEREISILKETLRDCHLTSVERQTIREEISTLEARIFVLRLSPLREDFLNGLFD